jgi:hypothetical protein
MLTEQDRFTSYENEFRQSLRRGYNRLRIVQGQELTLSVPELMLELLGDLQVLTFRCEHSGGSAHFNLPFVYLVPWLASSDRSIQDQIGDGMLSWLNKDTTTYSSYRRLSGQGRDNSPTQEVHVALGEALLSLAQVRPPVLEIITDPLARHERLVSENWITTMDLARHPNIWSFPEQKRLPRELEQTKGVIRISIPYEVIDDGNNLRVMTIIVGLACDSRCDPAQVPQRADVCWECRGTPLCRNGVRRLSDILATDFIDYYARLTTNPRTVENRGAVSATPKWLGKPLRDRDPLAAAVAELHREINRFLGTTDDTSAEGSDNGLTFLLAFRQLDGVYADRLRYSLSTLNLNSIVQASEVSDWRQKALDKLCESAGILKTLLGRNATSPHDIEQKWEILRFNVEQEINIFCDTDDMDVLRRRLAEAIEESPYPANLTPGYSIMTLGHPEIIKDWLTDPRAVGFEDYPARLLAWELCALPHRLYYSSLTDGIIPVGVCGIDAAKLGDRSVYDLQEIIDRKARRFRYILCRRELDRFKEVFEKQWGTHSPDEPEFLREVLLQFRQLAYYYLPSQHDYQTKLVWNKDLESLAGMDWNERWSQSYTQWRWTTDKLSKKQMEAIRAWKHISFMWGEKDYLGTYFESKSYNDIAGILHAVVFKPLGVTLLFFVASYASDYHYYVASELMIQVLSTAEAVFSGPGVCSSGGIVRALACYNNNDLSEVEGLRERLRRRGVDLTIPGSVVGYFWTEEWRSLVENHEVIVVFEGSHGLGTRQSSELKMFVDSHMAGTKIVFPVLIESATTKTLSDPYFGLVGHFDLRKDSVDELARAICGRVEKFNKSKNK